MTSHQQIASVRTKARQKSLRPTTRKKRSFVNPNLKDPCRLVTVSGVDDEPNACRQLRLKLVNSLALVVAFNFRNCFCA
ncbi:MAG: hypothetical protein OXFUSZZB_002627, partial [Candidatus Fervidibacter sp.]